MEGCSGAGHMKDFGNIRRVHMITSNDTLSSLPDRQSIYDSTFAFPPAALMIYTYENFSDTFSDAPEPYFWRSAMMSQWQIDPTNSSSWTPDQRAKVKRSTEIYRSWIRPILRCRSTSYFASARRLSLGRDVLLESELEARNVIHFSSEQQCESKPDFPGGLTPDAKYKIRTEDHSTTDSTYSGRDLMNKGLNIALPGVYTSDLVYVEEIR